MKKAFTMIELVFVIVILGILASVAIPKLAATRDDAEVMAGLQRMSSILSDVGSYYTSHGVFAEIENMTHEELMKADLTKFDGNLSGTTAYFGNTARTKKCLSITIDDMNGTLNIMGLNENSAFCQALERQLGQMIGAHKFGGSAIYE